MNMDTATDIYNTHSSVAQLDDGVAGYYKNYLASLIGTDTDDDWLAADLEREIEGWESAGDRQGDPLWPKYVELLRAALAALRAGTLDRTLEETRAERLERIARRHRREERNLAILRAALGC
jgi:hypothetical protein